MFEDPSTIRRNIAHYERLLKLHSPNYTHENVRKLLTEAGEQLRVAEKAIASIPPLGSGSPLN